MDFLNKLCFFKSRKKINKSEIFYCLLIKKDKLTQIEQQLKVKIEDEREAPWNSSIINTLTKASLFLYYKS